LGFISTPAEERYLNTAEGVNNLSNGIYRAFLSYKQEQAHRPGQQPALPLQVAETSASAPDGDEEETPAAAGKPVFKVQILASSELLKSNDKRLKGLKGVEHYEENGLYKYTYGASSDYNRMVRTRRSVLGKFKQAFIVAFKDGRKMDINQAIREFKENR